MRIGIDLDDTIFNTTKQYIKFLPNYLSDNNITEEELWKNKNHRYIFITTYFEDIFLNLEVKKNVRSTLKLIKKLNNEIYIITARSKKYSDNIYNITKDSLIKKNILFDKLILTEKEKLEACIENKIDLMIDNSIDVYKELNNSGVKFLLYDESNKKLDIENRVSSWKEISKLFRGDKK